MRELYNKHVSTPTPAEVTQLQGKKSKPRMLLAQEFKKKMGCLEVFSCSDGSSNFSVLNFVVVVVCLENVAPELLQLYVRICIAFFFFFLLSCLILCFRKKKFGKSGSQHFIDMLFLINC